MPAKASGAKRTVVVIAAVTLLVLALVHAGIVALFAVPLWQSRNLIIRIGEFRVYSEFAHYGIPIFAVLCLLCAYAGLAAMLPWKTWAIGGAIAGWSTIALFVYGFWTFLNLLAPGLPYFPIPVGVHMPMQVALAAGAIGIFVLWAMRKPSESKP